MSLVFKVRQKHGHQVAMPMEFCMRTFSEIMQTLIHTSEKLIHQRADGHEAKVIGQETVTCLVRDRFVYH